MTLGIHTLLPEQFLDLRLFLVDKIDEVLEARRVQYAPTWTSGLRCLDVLLFYLAAVSAELQADSEEEDGEGKEACDPTDEEESPEALEREAAVVDGVGLDRARLFR